MPRSAITTAAFSALLAVCLLACGVGPVKETVFSYGAMDSNGGTVEAGDVTIVIPPGGLSGPTTIAILPEENPLAILAPPSDPCGYTLLGPQWCCGPIGLDLLQPGQCTVRYEELLIPPSAVEGDLVLLLWDDTIKALVPAPNAIQDLNGNFFTVPNYRTLGHLAVGISGCPEFGIVIAGAARATTTASTVGSGASGEQTLPDPLVTGMYLASLDGSTPPLLLPTNGEFPQAFVASPDDTRVLFLRFFLADSESEDRLDAAFVRQIYSVGVDGSPPVLVAGDDESPTGPDPSYGWLRFGSTVFFQEIVPGDDAPDLARLATAPGVGGQQPTSLYELGEFGWILDLRQSPDGSRMLVRYLNDFEEEVIDVFEVPAGTPVSQGLIPVGGGQSTPRFTADGAAVYLVSDARDTAISYAPDGTGPATLFTLPTEQGLLKDFLVAPNGDDYAYIAQVGQGGDVLYVGSFSGGPRANTDLGVGTTYEEFLFHPNGLSVLLDVSRANVRIFASADALEGPTLVAIDMRLLDIHQETGQILMTVPPARAIVQAKEPDELPAQTAPIGVYLADADGANAVLVPTPSDLEIEQARWLRTIRRAPGMPFENRIR